MTNLIIVESPAKCNKIEGFLGNNFKCIASGGHLLKIENLKDINVKKSYKIQYHLIKEKKKFHDVIKKEIKKCKKVYIATDDDREGELIGYLICKLFNLDIEKTDRLIFHEITKQAVIDALAHPVKINMNIVHSAKARQVIDMFVGYKITPILWNHINRNNMSAGRCQIPALRLVYDNYKEKQKESISFNYAIHAYFTDKHILFKLDKLFTHTNEVEEFLRLSISFHHTLLNITNSVITKPSPLSLNTSTLQQLCSNQFNISPKQTMSICQSLYEKGLITYMRTTSTQLSTKFQESAKKYITSNYSPQLFTPIPINDEQHAHEAIRPTNVTTTFIDKSFSLLHQKIYKLIWKISLQSIMKKATFTKYIINISAPESCKYTATFEEPIDLGWLSIDPLKDKVNYVNYFRQLSNKVVDYKKIETDMSIRDMKSYYTEAKLVSLLESKGIGRPSTFSSIIEKIKERKYVEKKAIPSKKKKVDRYVLEIGKITKKPYTLEYGGEKNKLIIQNKGIIVIDFLLKSHNRLFNYEYTRMMEDELDDIIDGEKSIEEVCNKCLDEIKHCNSMVKKTDIKIDDMHSYIIGKYGPVIQCKMKDKTIFKSVKKDVDIDKLKAGEYSISELVEETYKVKIGMFKQEELFLCKGQYGIYAQWSDNKKSLPFIKCLDTFDIKDIIDYLEQCPFYLALTKDISIREGKYGKYIYYKKKNMKKPKFYKYSFEEESDKEKILKWIQKTYNIS